MKSSKSKYSVNQLVIISLLTAIAYAVMFVGRVPMVAFLKYDPKDIVIMLSGMAFGPAITILMSIITSFIEFMTVSNDGIIGLFMNVLSTVAFVTLATIIYKKHPNNKGLIVGLAAGTIFMTLVMVGWNYIVTPVYLKIPQAEVVKMLLPVIVPFNIILVKTYFESLPPDIEESAIVDGAGTLTIFFRIMWPLSLPILATIAIFGAVGHWNSFQDSLILMQGNRDLFTLQHRLYDYLKKSTNLASQIREGLVSGINLDDRIIQYTISMVSIIPIMLVYPFMQRYFIKGIMMGAVKG